jgi:putative ABC transport system ATP-binding protein
MDHVVKRYPMGELTITALKDVTFEIEKGEFAVIVGPSAPERPRCSTSWGAWIPATAAALRWTGACKRIPRQASDCYRRYDIGFVFPVL